jgi:ribonuclease P protein component
MPRLCRFDQREERTVDEAHVSAQPAPPEEDPRVPGAHEDAGRPQGPQAPASEGAETAHRLERRQGRRFPRRERLASGAEFQALFQQGKRVDRSSFTVLWRPGEGVRRAGFAVSRQVRGAVGRNRARRRLREAYRATREAAPEGVHLVVIGKSSVLREPYADLVRELREALAAMAPAGGRRSEP